MPVWVKFWTSCSTSLTVTLDSSSTSLICIIRRTFTFQDYCAPQWTTSLKKMESVVELPTFIKHRLPSMNFWVNGTTGPNAKDCWLYKDLGSFLVSGLLSCCDLVIVLALAPHLSHSIKLCRLCLALRCKFSLNERWISWTGWISFCSSCRNSTDHQSLWSSFSWTGRINILCSSPAFYCILDSLMIDCLILWT